MDLSTVMTKIDTHQYLTAKDFLADVDLISSNALEYNPDKDPGGKQAHSLVSSKLVLWVAFTWCLFTLVFLVL